MADELGEFNVELKVGLGKCSSIPGFEEFVKLSGMNSFGSQTVTIEDVAVDVNLQSSTEETKFVLIQPIAIKNGENWEPLTPGTPEHDTLANLLSFTNAIFNESTSFGRILVFYDGLAKAIVQSPVKFVFAKSTDTKIKYSGVKIQIITAGITPKVLASQVKTQSATQTPVT